MQTETLQAGNLTWFYREALPEPQAGGQERPPVVLLHGLVSQSYSWRKVMPVLAQQGFRAIAPDWIGAGRSEEPEKRQFAYSPDAFVAALGQWLDALGLGEVTLVVQGFQGSVGVQYALRHPERVHRLAILNAPIVPEARLPWKIKQMGIPLLGEVITQDPILVDRTLEGGGGYVVDDKDLDEYRRPFLKSSSAGRSLQATIQGLKLKAATAEIAAGLKTWDKPVLLAWGDRDPWLPIEQVQDLAQQLPDGKLVALAEVGHYPQEDWHEKVTEVLLPFLRRKAL
ncbi:MAG: alpha/beta fold hydrolase [Synechococcales cyanobacterium RM1_1_8]|nr:alpha/beta fold hydrolase [Synechococcales cyanobacterium RM1_1_8]